MKSIAHINLRGGLIMSKKSSHAEARKVLDNVVKGK